MNSSFSKISGVKTAPATVQLIEVIGNAPLITEVRILLSEYGRYMYEELAFTAGKESFFKELPNFPGPAYLPPGGTFIVAMLEDKVAGCAGIRKFDEESCEMKRMYIRPAYRGMGIGRLLCNYVIEWCRKSKYKRILLDSNEEMTAAVVLYHKCGFTKIAPYCINENAHAVFMEYIL